MAAAGAVLDTSLDYNLGKRKNSKTYAIKIIEGSHYSPGNLPDKRF